MNVAANAIISIATFFKHHLVFLVLGSALTLQACGGGGGGGGGGNAPVAVVEEITLNEGATATRIVGGATSVLTNDTDAESNSLTAILDTDASFGTLTLNSDGTFTYSHNGSENFTDSFTYHANDGASDSNIVTVTITISPINDPAVANPESITVNEGATATTLDGGVTSVLTNDTDEESDTLTAVKVTDPANGTVTLNADGTFSYTHNSGETTSDSFTYKANGGGSDSNTVTVSISINPVDDPTVLANDTNSITEDAVPNTVSGNVLSNDSDPDTALTVSNAATLNSASVYGTLIIDSTGAYSYTLNNGNATVNALIAGATLTETYPYVANGQSANLVITITGADDVAVLSGDTNSITEDAVPNTISGNVLSNDSDPDTALTVSNAATLNSASVYGTLSIDSTGAYTYTLNNGNAAVNALAVGASLIETYPYNANGQSADLVITINGADDAAVLNNDTNSVTENALPITASGNVLGNDTDPDTALTISNAAALTGTGTYGSLAINSSGIYIYTLDNGNAAVNALNTGDTLTEIYPYNANGQSANLVITINGITESDLIDVSGVWMGPTVVTSDPDGCSDGVGTVDQTAVSFTQTGSVLIAVTSNGSSLTGTINEVTGEFSFPLASNTAALSGSRPDLAQPGNDTAEVNWSADVDLAGTATAGGLMSGTISLTINIAGESPCTYSQSFTDNYFVYRHTGTENYNGVYATEGVSKSTWTDVGGGVNTSSEVEGFSLELEIAGANINVHMPTESDASIVSRTNTVLSNSYDPLTGYFTLVTEDVTKRDSNDDGIIDSTNTFHSTFTGIFVADPSVTNGTNGAPLLMANQEGYGRDYNGDKDVGGLPVGAGVDSGPAYGKRLTTSARTRTILVQKGNLAEEPRIVVGLGNPPLKVVDPVNSKLWVEILDGATVAGSSTVLCASPYFNQTVPGVDGRYFIHLDMPDPDVNALAFRTNNVYSSANCDASAAGAVDIPHGAQLTVRILDTGPNGIKDTTGVSLAGDDVATVFPLTTEVAPLAERYIQNTNAYDIKVNGASSSLTQRDSTNRLRGFINGTKPVNVSWPAHPETTTRYQLRVSEPGGFVKQRFNTANTSDTLPAGFLGPEDITLQLRAINDTSNGALVRAHSRKLKFYSGVRGAFNVEVNHPEYQFGIFQVSLNGNQAGFGCAIRKPVEPTVLTCTGGSIDFVTDTITVNLLLSDTTPATLTLVFSDAVTATASLTDSVSTWTGNASLSGKELRVRSVLTSSGTQSTLFSMHLPNRAQGTLSSQSGQDLGAGATNPFDMWLDNFDFRLRSFYGLPMDDLTPQSNMTFISNNMASLLTADTFTMTMQNTAGDPNRLRYVVDYSSPDPSSLYLALELPPSRTSFTLNSVAVPGTASSIANAIDLTPSGGAMTLSWPNNLADSANTRYQIRVRFRDSFTGGVLPHDQFRTTRLGNGSGGLSLAGGIWTWSSAGIFALPAGTYADVEVIASDVANTMWGRSQRFVVTMP